MPSKPPTIGELTWIGDLKFRATINDHTLTLDSGSKAGPTPVETLALSLAGCMSIDLVHILTKGRHPVSGLRAHIEADRAPEDPKRFTRVRLRFTLAGGAPRDAIERAVALSREKYCSVWQSMRQDIDLQVTVEAA